MKVVAELDNKIERLSNQALDCKSVVIRDLGAMYMVVMTRIDVCNIPHITSDEATDIDEAHDIAHAFLRDASNAIIISA